MNSHAISYTHAELRQAAALRHPGFYKQCLRVGKQIGDRVHFERQALDEARRQHPHLGHALPPRGKIAPKWFKLGEWVHAIALPIAKLFRLRCVDPRTGKLRPTSPCQRRRMNLNTWSDKIYFRFEHYFFKTLNFLKRL